MDCFPPSDNRECTEEIVRSHRIIESGPMDRQISLTEAGQAYYENAARILGELEEADRRVGALQSTPRGRLRLHVGTHIVRFVAPVMAEYMRLYPELAVELT